MIVSGKGFLILSPLINVAAVAMEAEHEENGQEQWMNADSIILIIRARLTL